MEAISTSSAGKEASRWLSQASLRPTRQRRALATLLVEGGDRHLTAEALFAEAQASGADVSLATVYNALRAFTDAGLLREVHIDAGRVYYDTRIDDHPHFYYEDDGSIADAPVGSVKIAALPDVPDGCEIASVDVVVRLRRR